MTPVPRLRFADWNEILRRDFLDAAKDVGELERAASGPGAVRRRPSRR